MGYRLRPKARHNLSEIIAHIAAHNPAAARKWRDGMFRIFKLLGDNPYAGSAQDEVGPQIRMFPSGRYIVIYRIESSGVLILSVIHASRDWRRKPT